MKSKPQRPRRGGIFVAAQRKEPSQLRPAFIQLRRGKQERHIPPLTGLEILVDWFSTTISLLTELRFPAGCSPPAPARKAMSVRSGLSGNGCARFQMHAPQWTHFSRSNTGTPPSPGAMAWPEQILGE
jgi:hypothetical protein